MRYSLSLAGVFLCLWLAAQPSYFPPLDGADWSTTDPAALGFCPDQIDSLYQFLEARNSDVFLLLEDGKLVLERYFGDFEMDTPHAWNSAGKTVTATAIGIAQQEGLLDLDDPASDYLGVGWTSCTPAEEALITVRHLLSQTSGLNDEVADVFCTDAACLECIAAPGERWAYHNGSYTQLTYIIEAASGQSLNQFVNQRIRQPTGMGGGFFSNSTYNRTFGSDARSMARFGLLIANGGNWADTPVLDDPAYVTAMTTPSQALNPAYGYLWWLNGQSSYLLPGFQQVFSGTITPNAPADMYAGIGKNGQLLIVVPSQNRVIIRMGDNPGYGNGLVGVQLLNELWTYLNALDCGTTATPEPMAIGRLAINPNPTAGYLRISAGEKLRAAGLYTLSGQRVAGPFLLHEQLEIEVRLDGVGAGVYLLRLTTAQGAVRWERVMVR